jgi:hypothetical protein
VALVVAALGACTECGGDRPPDAAPLDTQPSFDTPSPRDTRVPADSPAPPDSPVPLDAQVDPALWRPLADDLADCAAWYATDPERAIGAWDFDACEGVEGCVRLRRESFPGLDSSLDRLLIPSIGRATPRSGVTLGFGRSSFSDGVTMLLHAGLRRAGGVEVAFRGVITSSPSCYFGGLAMTDDSYVALLDDLRGSSRDELRGRSVIVFGQRPADILDSRRVVFDVGALSGNVPQEVAFGRDLWAIRLFPSTRMATVQADGTYDITRPAPPYEDRVLHGIPSVVGRSWVSTVSLGPSANGIFQSDGGRPSERIWPVDATGTVVADEERIVWLQGSAVRDTVMMDHVTIWQAPYRVGPISELEARIVRPIEEIAMRYGTRNPGTAFLEVSLGEGYLAMADGRGLRCYVVRLADGHLAEVPTPTSMRCQAPLYVNGDEVALVGAAVGDEAGRTTQAWFIPIASLTFRP